MPQSFPAELRIVQDVATLVGADNSLESINTAKLSNRALVAVEQNNSLYMLRKEATDAPSAPDIVQPTSGPCRWFIYSTGSATGDAVVRCDWCFGASTTSITFAAGVGPIYNVVAEAGSFASVSQGDSLFVQPVQALVGFFHSGTPAPWFGGVWDIVEKLDDQNLRLQRVTELATSAQIDATALITVDGGTSPGVYQVATPPGGTIDVDPQVMPWVSRPVPAADGSTYKLQANGEQLFWTLDP